MKQTVTIVIIALLAGLLGWQIGRATSPAHTPDIAAAAIDDTDDGPDIEDALDALDLSSARVLDYKGDTIPLRDLDDGRTIFVRYSSTGCRPCIKELTEWLEHYKDSVPDRPICMLVSDIALRDLYVTECEEKGRFAYYATQPLAFDIEGLPVIFTLDRLNRAANVSYVYSGSVADALQHISHL